MELAPLAAFQSIADALYALDAAARVLAAVADASAKKTLTLTRQQLDTGYINALALCNAQQTYQQARAARLADTAALFQAFGNAWPGGY